MTLEETMEAETFLIRASQSILGSKKALIGNFNTLNTFINDKEILRVDGRLSNTSVCNEQRHPAICEKF